MDRTKGRIGHRLAVAALPCIALLGVGVFGPASPPETLVAAVPAPVETLVAAVPAPVEAALPSPAPPEWTAPEVHWRPETPAEGTALALFIRPPEGARAPESVEAILDGRRVALLRTEDGWFGVGALPVETVGPRPLELAYRLGPDSVHRELRIVEVAPREFSSRQLRVAPRYTAPPADVLERIQSERARIRAALEPVGPSWNAGPEFVWPRPPNFTSGFGERRMFNDRVQSRHLGLDLAGSEGAPVLAPAAGRVVLAGDFYYQGKAVYVEHGLGVYTGYFHLSRIDVEEGDELRPGQLLGAVGATGRVTGPHLHWSAYVGGQNVDPASLLDLEFPAGLPEPALSGAGSR